MESISCCLHKIHITILVSNAKEDQDGCSYPTILNWIRDNGCVLAEACPYEGTFRSIGYVRQPCLWFQSHFHLDLGKELLYKGKNKHKSQERRLEYEIKQGLVLAEMLWIEEMHYLIGGGIYSGPEDVNAFDKTYDHGVMIVDFGDELVENKLVKYWVIRNSHGDKWGDNGYAKIDRARTHGRLLIHTAWVIKAIVKSMLHSAHKLGAIGAVYKDNKDINGHHRSSQQSWRPQTKRDRTYRNSRQNDGNRNGNKRQRQIVELVVVR
ncbi:cathepsin B [Trifolium repens]|nr:cathepsin B [Trifolium repens]